MSNNNGNGTRLTPTTTIERTWEGVPGAILRFTLSIALSGKMSTEREQAIALGTLEKAERLLDFRMRILSDTLDAAPNMIRIDALTGALEAKIEAAVDATTKGMPESTDEEKAEKEKTRELRRKELSGKIKLTPDEVEALAEPLPGFPEELTPETAYEYFSQTDEKGRKVFQLLVEDIISEFWFWATPRPTISVSAFMQDK